MLRWLWEYHGAPKLDGIIRHYQPVSPRNVTVDTEDYQRLLAACPKQARLWLLLCSDLAMRSGTAARVGPENYHPQTRSLAFTTKYGARVTLPVTEEIRVLIEECDMTDPRPFIRQLWHRRPGTRPGRHLKDKLTPRSEASAIGKIVRSVKKQIGMSKHWVMHDLRRTTACALYDHTHDIRDVQALLGHKGLPSTIWYLDHRLRQVKRSNLEIIKRPAWRKEQTA